MRGRWSLWALTVAVLVLAFGATPTTVHTTASVRSFPDRTIDRSGPEYIWQPCNEDCEVIEHASAETGPWDESASIPTARWEARNGRLTLAIEVRPPSPRVGEQAHVRLVATVDGGGLISSALAFGSEEPSESMRVIIECRPPGMPVTAPERRVVSRKTSVRQVRFNATGLQQINALGEAHRCGGGGEVELTGVVAVRPSDLPTNGPARPTATVGASSAWKSLSHSRFVELLVGGEDRDGYVRRLEIDWGDGTSSETVETEAEFDVCRRNPVAPSAGIGPTSRPHLYTRDGAYTVTVTAVSTGCDGRTRQTGRAHYVVTVPAG